MAIKLTNQDGVYPLKSHESQITQVQTACVQDNHVLALSINRQDVDRCIRLIRQYGLLTPPVVGSLSDGAQVLLSGECEFMALREIGAKRVDAVTVALEEESEGTRLSLLLSAMKKSQNALSEGLLITQLFKNGGYTQAQLGEMLGKSVSWINKRISLVTRLKTSVQELVMKGLLCPQSAQEISRLPSEAQHKFSVAVIQEGLPKSSVEMLVAAFNASGCPDSIKEQIVSEPRQAMERLSDARTVKPIRSKPADTKLSDAANQKQRWDALRRHMAGIIRDLYVMAAEDMDLKLLNALRCDVAALLIMIDKKLSISPGKKEGVS